VIDIHMPALRERREDLPASCARPSCARIAAESGIATPPLPAELAGALADRATARATYAELENLLHRAVALRDHQGLQLDPPVAADISDPPAQGANFSAQAASRPNGSSLTICRDTSIRQSERF